MRILKSNSQLRNLPSLIGEDPYDSGWVCEVEVMKRDIVKKVFCDSVAAKTLYHEQVDKMGQALSVAEKPSLGITMMDGGTGHKSLKSIIGVHDYIDLLKAMLSLKK